TPHGRLSARTSRAIPCIFAGVRLSRNFGKEAALTAGLEHARGDAVVIMDADLQHPPDLLAEMIRAWREEGYEIVEAVKEQRGQESALSRIGAKYFYPVFARLSGLDIHAATDFKLLTRRVVDNLGQLKERGVFFRGMVAWLGFRRKRLPFSVPARA
ncbi:MAG: glycosyltransferase family 2 protein, partial [Chloroflexi bacterium]|nr:glycosyltransferase family 2 protein [Chloroflexota bacterium]